MAFKKSEKTKHVFEVTGLKAPVEPVPATAAAPVEPVPATAAAPVTSVVEVSTVAQVRAQASPKYRVRSKCQASFYGQPVRLAKDDIIDSSGYGGADGIKRFIESGADLEEIK
jgi:hypothetical protein